MAARSARPEPAGWRRRVLRLGDGGTAIADVAGHVAAFVLLLLTLAIVLGITLRWVGIDNAWTYDLDLYTLVWVSFIGAVLTARRDRHVTAGIALEHVFGGRGTILAIVRAVVIIIFLALFTISGWWAALESWQTQETTIDIAQWPVWIAKAALPAGAALWALAEAAKLLRRLGGAAPEPSEAAAEPDL